MKFSCEKLLLQNAVNTASRAVAAKSSIPALEGLLLTCGGEGLTINEAPDADGLEACLKEHGEAYIAGALTDTMVIPLLRSGLLRSSRLVVADPSKVLLKPDTLDKLAVRDVTLQTKDAARTLCVTVNPVSAYGWKFDKDEFIDRMRQSVKVPVINVKEELA